MGCSNSKSLPCYQRPKPDSEEKSIKIMHTAKPACQATERQIKAG